MRFNTSFWSFGSGLLFVPPCRPITKSIRFRVFLSYFRRSFWHV